VDEVKRQNDTVLLEILAVVREELDEVAENFIDDFTAMTNVERAEVVMAEDEDEDEKNPIDSLTGMTAGEKDEMVEKDEDKDKDKEQEKEKE
jgi:hypothetical protein